MFQFEKSLKINRTVDKWEQILFRLPPDQEEKNINAFKLLIKSEYYHFNLDSKKTQKTD